MKRIIVYVSDHGLGHAARTVALVRKLAKFDRFEIIVKNSSAHEFLSSCLPGIPVEKIQTDVGPIYDWARNKVDMDKTFASYSKFIKNESEWIRKETASFSKKPADLIITDISPIALRLAEQIKCRAISVANFSWIDILEKLPFHKDKKMTLDWLEESFLLADFVIKLPLSMKLYGFSKSKESSFLCRDLTTSPKNTLLEFGLKSSPILSYFGTHDVKIKSKYDIMHLQNGNLILNGKKIRKIFYEAQNLVSASNVVVSKIGYGIIAECLKFRRPMVLVSRANYSEDEFLRKEIGKFGIAKITDLKDARNGIQVPARAKIKEMNCTINEKLISEIESKEDAAQIVSNFLR